MVFTRVAPDKAYLVRQLRISRWISSKMAEAPPGSISSPFADQLELRQYLRQQLQPAGISLEDVEKWIVRPPRFTTIRFNPLRITKKEAVANVRNRLANSARFCDSLKVYCHPVIEDMIIAENKEKNEVVVPSGSEVIVDMDCGQSVLRGADVYAAGVLGAPKSMQAGDKVAVFADLDAKCLRGWTKYYNGNKFFLGNGLVHVSRKTMFGPVPVDGMAIQMTECLYPCPSLYGSREGSLFPQNFPSAVCVHVLDPQPGDKVLDMCAAPGGKATHIASLMKNEGAFVAMDVSDYRVRKLKENLDLWGGGNFAHVFKFDAIKSFSTDGNEKLEPPFSAEVFDKVIVDAPCSGLGQRPQLRRHITIRALKLHASRQKHFLRVAAKVLKVGGTLVYSTCSLTVTENEQVVSDLLQTLNCLELVPQYPRLGRAGLPGEHNLNEEQLNMLQRFITTKEESCVEKDTIAFFIAKFRKMASL